VPHPTEFNEPVGGGRFMNQRTHPRTEIRWLPINSEVAMKLLARLSNAEPINDLRATVRRVEDAGVMGLSVGDHIIAGDVGRPDAFTLLAAVGAISDSLLLLTAFANVTVRPPVLTVRTIGDLAQIFGGGRVIAGFGCGWDADELRAIGQFLPPHASRIEVLRETLMLAADLYRSGSARAGSSLLSPNVHFEPIKPVPALAVGGGSLELLELGGQLADMVDLNAPARRRAGESWRAADARSRAEAQIDELRVAAGVVSRSAGAAGRLSPQLSLTLAKVEITDKPLAREAVETSPFILRGDRQQVVDRIAELEGQLGVAYLNIPWSQHGERLAHAWSSESGRTS
jgi:alkanesulfonate monooxygenase SsuD/methylene tetrahydromethanopterin reductase-like flavin-dependent oxidoreductase (luciferase family)